MVEWEEASQEVINIAQDLVEQHHKHLQDVRIGFVFRSEAQVLKGRAVLGKCSNVSDKMKPLLDLDFLIWIAKDEYKKMDEERRRALIDHELSHIGIDLTLQGHDVEEFHAIIERYGLWTYDLMKTRKAMDKAEQLRLDNLANGVIKALDMSDEKKVSVAVKTF